MRTLTPRQIELARRALVDGRTLTDIACGFNRTARELDLALWDDLCARASAQTKAA